MNKYEKQRNIFKSMSLSFIIAFFVPLLIACVGFIFLINLLNNQVSETNRSALFRLRDISDANLQNVQSIGKLLIRNDEVQTLKNIAQPLTKTNLLSCLKLMDELNTQMLTNNLIETINITFNSSNSIISSDGFFHGPDNNSQSYSNINMSYEQWKETLSFSGFSSVSLHTMNDGLDHIFITYKDSSQIDLQHTVAVTLILNTEKVQALLDSLKFTDESSVMILDQAEHLVTSDANNFTPDDLDLTDLDYETLTVRQKSSYKGAPTLVNYVPSGVTPWIYLLVTPHNIYSKQILISVIILIGYIVLCGVVGSLLIPRSIKQNYSPISRLVNTLISQLEPNHAATQNPANRNEYAIIEDGLANLLNKILHNEEKLSEHEKVLTDKALRQIVTGRVRKDSEIRSIFEFHKIVLPNPNYSIMLFSIEDYGELGTRDDASSLDIIQFIIASAISEIVQTRFPCQTFEVDFFSVCLVNLAPDSTTEDLLEIATKANSFVKNKFNISLSTAIGRIVNSTTKINSSYQDALLAIDYVKTMGLKNQVILYDTIIDSNSVNNGWSDFGEHDHQFMNLMLAENFREAYNLLNNMIQHDFNSNEKNLSNIKMKMTALITTVVMATNKITPYPEDIFSDENNPIHALYDVDSLPELKAAIAAIFDGLIKYADQQKLKEPSRQDEIIAYVKDHYRNPDLNVSSIAENFNISISYVSRLFKNLTGTGLLDYVHYLRIEDAKLLLKTTNMSIKDISTKVGYYNSLTMTRAFRRYEGVTPSDFRGIQ